MSQLVLFAITDPLTRYHTLLGRNALTEYRSDEALTHFRGALKEARKFLQEEPRNFIGLRDLAICWDQIGSAHQQAGEISLAYNAYDEAHDRFEELAKIEGEAGHSARELARFLYRFAGLAMHDENWKDAALLLDQSHGICLARLKLVPMCSVRITDLAEVQDRIVVVRRNEVSS